MWVYCWEGCARASDPDSSLDLVNGPEQHASKTRDGCSGQTLGGWRGGRDYNPPTVTYFYPDVLLPKSLLFHGLGWEDEWGKNLLSGQGLKGFMGFISALEQRAGMKAKMLVPGQSYLGLSTMETVFYRYRSIDKV